MKNPLALGLALLGSLAMVIATFLPLNESGSVRRIEDNTLIQQGGWVLIALAIWIAVGAYYVDQGRQRAALAIVPCVLAAVWIVYVGTTAGTQTLYPIGADGTPDTSQPGITATMGTGIYLGAVGVAVALIGSVMLRRPSPKAAPDNKPVV